MLLPIIMILVCVLLGGGTLLFLKFSERRKKAKSRDKEELAQMTANEFVNVKDIRGSFLYTRDGMALAYLKIFPISTELFSKNEKRLIAKQFTASLSSGQYPFQLLAVSRPVDISPLMAELSSTLTASSNIKQKELLKHEIVEMGGFALSGEVVERQFYIKIWDRAVDGVERDLLQKLKYLSGYFADCGIQTEILEQQDIVRLLSLIHIFGIVWQHILNRKSKAVSADPVHLHRGIQFFKVLAEIGQFFFAGPFCFTFPVEVGAYLCINPVAFRQASQIIPDDFVLQKIFRTVRASGSVVFFQQAGVRGQGHNRKHLAHFEPPPFRPPNISRRNSSVSFADCTLKVTAEGCGSVK